LLVLKSLKTKQGVRTYKRVLCCDGATEVRKLCANAINGVVPELAASTFLAIFSLGDPLRFLH
jgi:hypothetical protein